MYLLTRIFSIKILSLYRNQTSKDMSKFSVFFLFFFSLLIVAHLFYSIDYNQLFTVGNKGGATGIIVSLLGIVSVFLAQRSERKEQGNI